MQPVAQAREERAGLALEGEPEGAGLPKPAKGLDERCAHGEYVLQYAVFGKWRRRLYPSHVSANVGFPTSAPPPNRTEVAAGYLLAPGTVLREPG
jgi:hypothetical protein